ncbi:MAG: class I SAM-dependent methyltransferase [Acidobacteriota bacterium]
MTTSTKTAVCRICGTAAALAGVKNEFSLYRCGSCGFLFVHPLPDDTLAIYNDDYFQGAGGGHGYMDYDRDKEPMRPTFEQYLVRMQQALGKPGRVLDVGAATGFFLDIARQKGWDTAGVASDFAARLGRKKGLDVRTGILQDATFPDASFDAVTLWDVIEHLSDPEKAVRDVRRLLKPGGLFALNTPDADSLWAKTTGMNWHLIVPPEHIHLFGRRSAVKLLDTCGFEPLTVTTIGKTFTIQYVLQTLGPLAEDRCV